MPDQSASPQLSPAPLPQPPQTYIPGVNGANGADFSNPDLLAEKLIFSLAVYPRLTSSMLQIAVGMHVSQRLWRPVLQKLVQQGTVKHIEQEVVTPVGQYRNFKFYELANPTDYTLDRLRQKYLHHQKPLVVGDEISPPVEDGLPLIIEHLVEGNL